MNDPKPPSLARLPAGIWALGVVSLLMDVSSEMIHALLPLFMVGTLGMGVAEVGLLEGLAEATALVVKVFSGAISDWVGRRKPLAVLGYGLAAVTKPLFALATGPGLVVAARLLDRVGKGIRGAPRDALVADLAPPDRRGAAFGLRQALDTVGAFAGPLLAVGRHLEGAASPVLDVLANAERPDILIDKWMRLERYGHATNRTDIRLDGERALDFRRYSTGAAPTAAENALIAGFLLGICGLAGAGGLSLEIDGQRFDALSLAYAGPLSGASDTFRISWTDWEPPALSDIPETGSLATGERLKALLASDAARGWSLAEAARSMAKSTRSLQRELGAAGISFSSALRGVRTGEAARLIRAGRASLAEIGYCCGYADQPHFQRDFRRALNMSPGEYRRLSLS